MARTSFSLKKKSIREGAADMSKKQQAMPPSSMLPTGTRFEVTDNSVDGTYGPGTSAAVSYVRGKDRDFSNVFFMRAIVTKRGKGGKNRLEEAEFSCPIFDFGADNEKFVAKMPDEKRKYYVHITQAASPPNLLDLSDLDFISWAMAYATFIQKLSSRAQHYSPWPQESQDILNRLLNAGEYWSEDESYCHENFAAEEARIAIIDRIRLMENGLVTCVLSYMRKVSDIEIEAVKQLASTFSPNDLKLPKDAISNAYTAYAKKEKVLASLVGGKRKAGTKWV